jgi:hypothetical protein
MINRHLIIFLIILTSCGLDCVDNKTGIAKSSQTLEESKKNNVFCFEMTVSDSFVILDSLRSFKIVDTWVENKWHYDCLNNKAVIKKDSFYQLKFYANYRGNIKVLYPEYNLMNKELTMGSRLGGQLDFDYNGEDTISLILAEKDSTSWNFRIIKKLNFIKKVSR